MGLQYDFVKVLDFGLVSRPQGDVDATRLTAQGVTVGTPGFMAPEMIRGQKIEARADLYSLGCVGYFLLTGEEVFEGLAMKALVAHLKDTPVPPSRLRRVAGGAGFAGDEPLGAGERLEPAGIDAQDIFSRDDGSQPTLMILLEWLVTTKRWPVPAQCIRPFPPNDPSSSSSRALGSGFSAQGAGRRNFFLL